MEHASIYTVKDFCVIQIIDTKSLILQQNKNGVSVAKSMDNFNSKSVLRITPVVNVKQTYTILRSESFNLADCKHFFQLPTTE